jgi:hypothetical protein
MTSLIELPLDLADIVNGELNTGERIVWLSQPLPSRYARMGLPAVLFAIPWTAFAIFWIAGASGFKMPDFSSFQGLFPLFGLPFVLVGLGMFSAPYWMRRAAMRTAYLITDQRAIVIKAHVWRGFTIRSFAPERLTDLERTQYPDGSGNLIFERQQRRDCDGDPQTTRTGFIAIENVKEVENLIRDLAERSKPPEA